MCRLCPWPIAPVNTVHRRTYRIGRQTVMRDAAGFWFVTISNRSYESWHEVPFSTAAKFMGVSTGYLVDDDPDWADL